MLQNKTIKKITGLLLALFLIAGQFFVEGASVQAAGKQKALNITDLSLSVGQSQKLKVLNGKKVRWSSSKKTVASVSKKGVVKAKKAGKTTITAKVSGKKLKCNVVVRKMSAKKKDVLVAYFSQTGTTRAVAKKIRKLTGGDLMTANPKHKKRVRFYNSAKLVAATNGKILLQRPDDALHRRIVAIPCHHPIPHDAMQAYFVKQLADEMDSIASKAVLAYFQLRENHYQFAGDYRINEPWENGDSQKDEVEVIATEDCIKKYLVENYQPDSKGRVFIEDAYKEFTGVYSEMLLQKFSHLFVEEAEKIFNSKKDRKRREGASNAQACVLGISHI